MGVPFATVNQVENISKQITKEEVSKIPSCLPPIEQGDKGKVLKVKQDESGTQWSEDLGQECYTKSETDNLLGFKADNNNVMHLVNNEEVGGAKRFKDGIEIGNSPYTSENEEDDIRVGTLKIWTDNENENGDAYIRARSNNDLNLLADKNIILQSGPNGHILLDPLSGFVLPQSGKTVDIGAGSRKFRHLFLSGTGVMDSVNATNIKTANFETRTNDVWFKKDLIATNNASLGTSQYPFLGVNLGDNGKITSASNLILNPTSKYVIPNFDSSYQVTEVNIGHPSFKFNALYCDKLSDGVTTKTMTQVLSGGATGGTKLYRHTLKQGDNKELIIITTLSTPIVLTYKDYTYKLNGVAPSEFIKDNALSCYVDSSNDGVGLVTGFQGGAGSAFTAMYMSSHSGDVILCPADKIAEFLDTITAL